MRWRWAPVTAESRIALPVFPAIAGSWRKTWTMAQILPRGPFRAASRCRPHGECGEPRSTQWIGALIACPRGDLNPAEGFGDLLIRRLTCGNATCSYDQLPPV